MRTKHWLWLALAPAGLIAASGCGGSDCEDTATCAGASTGGASGAGGTGAVGGTGGTSGTTGGGGGTGATGGVSGGGGDSGTCDATKSPSEEACLVSDAYAVFVNGTVATSGNGTKASPFKSIGEALGAAGGKSILVCNTSYDEQVKLTAGVKLFGGFDCGDWSYKTGERALVKPSAKGYALEVDSVSAAVVIEDIEFSAQAGTAAGESSIAGFVKSSSDVKLRRVKLVAGKGITGANGVTADYPYPTQASLSGNSANVLAGGAPKACDCPAGDKSIGGAGGNAPTPQDGNPGLPALGGGTKGAAGSACNSGGGGGDGAPGTTPAAANGAATSGSVAPTGWSPAGGTAGKAGGVGQGGGGGASSTTGGGGGGGCGGCGGAGGPGGGGGGASIALMVLDSTVSADAGSVFVTADAGAGGSGAAGQSGQTQFGLAGLQAVGACPGGNGAPGGDGAAGGGGAGGVSVAVLWKGSVAPAIDSSASITLGNKGAKGVGGKPGTNDGIDGVSAKLLEVK